jgi:type II secretory pathway pseudopilin PulG
MMPCDSSILMNHRGRRRAVTLLEVVLALGILGFVTGMTYWFYASSLESNQLGTEEAQKLRLARSVLDRLTLEIRQAAMIAVDNQPGIRGEAERIQLSSIRVPSREQARQRTEREDPAPAEYDLIQVDYRIARHPDIEHDDGYEYPLGLARVEVPVPRPLPPQPKDSDEADEENDENEDPQTSEDDPNSAPGGRSGSGFGADESEADVESEGTSGEGLGPQIQWDELYAPEIRYMRFCYYDGAKWWDTWQVAGESPLPQLVMVTIGYEPVPPFGFRELVESEINEEYCTCLNEDPVDCEPLAQDQYTLVIRVPQADPLFRSRITRESQGMIEEMLSAEGEEQELP